MHENLVRWPGFTPLYKPLLTYSCYRNGGMFKTFQKKTFFKKSSVSTGLAKYFNFFFEHLWRSDQYVFFIKVSFSLFFLQKSPPFFLLRLFAYPTPRFLFLELRFSTFFSYCFVFLFHHPHRLHFRPPQMVYIWQPCHFPFPHPSFFLLSVVV